MIKNWAMATTIANQWIHNLSLVNVALSVLDAADCKHDIYLSLRPPNYNTVTGSLPVQYSVSSQGTAMLGCSIVELPTRGEVTLYAP